MKVACSIKAQYIIRPFLLFFFQKQLTLQYNISPFCAIFSKTSLHLQMYSITSNQFSQFY